MANYNKISVGPDARTELHDKLSLTGAEIWSSLLNKKLRKECYSSLQQGLL